MRSPVGLVTSLLLGLVTAVAASFVMHSAMGLWFGLMMPVMAGVGLLERLALTRRERMDAQARARALANEFAPISRLAAAGQARIPRKADGPIRLGCVPSAGRGHGWSRSRGQAERVVLADLSEGLSVICADERLAQAVVVTIEAQRSWGGVQTGRPLTTGDETSRLALVVRSPTSAALLDRATGKTVEAEFVPDVASKRGLFALESRLHAWREASEVESRAPVACEAITWDLFGRGTHALVSGVTGSGKTALIIAWLTSLSSNMATDEELAIVVIDFKGGGSFDSLATSARVRHRVSNLDPEAVESSLQGLRVQVEQRQEILARYGQADISGVPLVALSAEIPRRVVVVIDEFRALVEAFPEAQTLLTDIASRGRSLGLHLILATQRFTAVAGDALTANCGIRVALRCGDALESSLVIGSSLAHDASLLPGEGFVQVAGEKVRRFRALLAEPHEDLAQDRSPHDRTASSTACPSLWLEPPLAPLVWSDLTRLEPVSVNGQSLGASTSWRWLIGSYDNDRRRRREAVAIDLATEAVILVEGGTRSTRSSVCEVFSEQVIEHVAKPLAAPVAAPVGVRRFREAVETWDEMLLVKQEVVLLEEIDQMGSSLPLAWRELFVERIAMAIRERKRRGLVTVVTCDDDARWIALMRSLGATPLSILTSPRGHAERRSARALWNGIEVHLASVSSFAKSPSATTTQAPPSSRLESLHPADLSDALLVTGLVSLWINKKILGFTIASVEDWIFGRVKNERNGRLFIDGCTPAEARSLRLSPHDLPPPQAGTLVEVLPDGTYRRVNLVDVDLVDTFRIDGALVDGDLVDADLGARTRTDIGGGAEAESCGRGTHASTCCQSHGSNAVTVCSNNV